MTILSKALPLIAFELLRTRRNFREGLNVSS